LESSKTLKQFFVYLKPILTKALRKETFRRHFVSHFSYKVEHGHLHVWTINRLVLVETTNRQCQNQEKWILTYA